MEPLRLSNKFVKNLQPTEEPYQVLDTVMPGFGVRIYPSKAKRFFVTWTIGKKRFRPIIGDAKMGVKAGRYEAFKRLKQALPPARWPRRRGATRTQDSMRHQRRLLSEDELKRLWLAADQIIQSGYGDFVRFVMATGQRRATVENLSTSDIDLAGRRWAVKHNDSSYDLPLPQVALQFLAARPFLFDRNRPVFKVDGGGSILSGASKRKKRLSALARQARWRFSDFAYAQRVFLSNSGFPQHVIDRLQSVGSGVHETCTWRALSDAVTLWNEHLEKLSTGSFSIETKRRKHKLPLGNRRKTKEKP